MATRSGRTIQGQKKLEQKVVRFSQEIADWLNLENWDVRIAFNRDNNDVDFPDTACETVAKWEYSGATMTWNIDNIVGTKRHQLEELIIHEYVHILLSPIDNFVPRKHTALTEFTTENLARLLVRQWRKYRK